MFSHSGATAKVTAENLRKVKSLGAVAAEEARAAASLAMAGESVKSIAHGEEKQWSEVEETKMSLSEGELPVRREELAGW